MKVLLKYSAIACSLFCVNASFAQSPLNADKATSQAPEKTYINDSWKKSLVPDGTIDYTKDRTNRVLEWHNIREIDIAFKRRLWRRINVKEKQNMPFIYEGDEYSGGGAFVEMLIDGIKRGYFKAYSDDKFITELSFEDVKSRLSTEETVTTYDPETGEEIIQNVSNPFNPNDVAMYEIQEDYIFDRNSGRPQPRLRSITPLFAKKDPLTQEFRNFQPLFTIYYPDARQALGQYEVYNPQNDLHRMSWSDYLDRMMYSAYVIKSSYNNPTGEQLQLNSLEGLTKGQQEVENIIQKDMDMWEL